MTKLTIEVGNDARNLVSIRLSFCFRDLLPPLIILFGRPLFRMKLLLAGFQTRVCVDVNEFVQTDVPVFLGRC